MGRAGQWSMQRAAFAPPDASAASAPRLGRAAAPQTLGLGIISSVFSGEMTSSSQLLLMLNDKGIW